MTPLCSPQSFRGILGLVAPKSFVFLPPLPVVMGVVVCRMLSSCCIRCSVASSSWLGVVKCLISIFSASFATISGSISRQLGVGLRAVGVAFSQTVAFWGNVVRSGPVPCAIESSSHTTCAPHQIYCGWPVSLTDPGWLSRSCDKLHVPFFSKLQQALGPRAVSVFSAPEEMVKIEVTRHKSFRWSCSGYRACEWCPSYGRHTLST